MWGCFAVCATLLAAAAWGQDATPVFRATSDLVLLDVQVIHNKTNTAMGQLQARDFELSEDGAPQRIAFFESGQLPLSVVLLFDLPRACAACCAIWPWARSLPSTTSSPPTKSP